MVSPTSVIKLIVIGAGGHGAEVSSYVEDLQKQGEAVTVVGYVDEGRQPGPWLDSKVIGGFDDLELYLRVHLGTMFHYITAVGNNAVRRRLVEMVQSVDAVNIRPWTLRHPRAATGQSVHVGEGTCLAPGSILTTRVSIGRHCIVNVNASISHDAVVGDFSNINPGAVICGNASLGEGAYIGAGATVIEKVRIGHGTIVGAGAVVIRDLPDNITAVGVPARVVAHANAATVAVGEPT